MPLGPFTTRRLVKRMHDYYAPEKSLDAVMEDCAGDEQALLNTLVFEYGLQPLTRYELLDDIEPNEKVVYASLIAYR